MILEEINRIKIAKADIKTAIENKGVEVSSSAKIDDYASLIDDISSGGGSSKYGKLYDNYNGATTERKVISILEEVIIPKEIVTLDIDMRDSYVKKFKFEQGSLCTTFTNGSFNNVSTLEELELPPLLTALRSYLCRGTSIQSITIPAAVTSISENCFLSCRQLSQVNILGTIINIEISAFRECSNLTQFTIPSSVTTIGNEAFKESGITNANIQNVTNLGTSVFRDCSNLQSCVLNSDMTKIPNYTFYGCSSLSSITIPNSVTTIGTYTFAKCGFTSITIPNGVATIETGAFYQSSLQTIDIPSTVTTMDNDCFKNSSDLNTVIIRAVTPPTIGSDVFAGNSNNLKIYVPADSVEVYKSASRWSSYASKIQAIPSE